VPSYSGIVNRFPKSLALVAGLVSALGFAPLNWWPLTFACLAILLHLVSEAPNLRGGLLRSYWFGVGHFTVGLNWIAGAFQYQDAMPKWLGWIAVVLLSLYLAIYPAMAAGLAWRWGRSRPVAFILFFAAAWIVTEYLRATMFTGFSWNPLSVVVIPVAGVAQYFAPGIGTYGLSGLLVLVAGGLAHLVPGWIRRVKTSYHTVEGEWVTLVIWPFVAAFTGIFVFFSMGYVMGSPEESHGPLIRVVQPNIGQQDKHVKAFDDMLVTGGVALVEDKEGYVIAARNSTFVLTPGADIIARYDKAHLVPYGEYLPMRPVLSALGLSRLVPGDLDFWPGPGPQSTGVPGFGRMGVQICYEIIFSGHVIDRNNRPDFLFNPSNDAWFGPWGPPQHLAQARLRAIEEGIPVVRSTPTGISAVIDADGNLLHRLPYRKAGFIETHLPPPHPPTLFARYGNILSLGFAFFLGALGIALGRFRR